MATRFAVFDLDKSNDNSPPKTIHEAAERGDLDFISRMVERTVELNIDERDQLQRTPLHWAAELGHQPVAEMLLDYGSDISATECNGRTPVHLAARSGNVDMLSTLLESKTDDIKEKLVNQPDNFGITPVFLAVQKGEDGRKAFEFLMGCGGRYSEINTTKGA